MQAKIEENYTFGRVIDIGSNGKVASSPAFAMRCQLLISALLLPGAGRLGQAQRRPRRYQAGLHPFTEASPPFMQAFVRFLLAVLTFLAVDRRRG